MIKKFKASFHGISILFVIDLIAISFYCICLLVSKDNGANQSEAFKTSINVISNLLIVAISIMTTSMLSIPLIEVKEKNKLYTATITDDILNLSDDMKEKLLNGLESLLYFKNSQAKQSMYQSVTKKIASIDDTGVYGKYFFDYSEYKVRCWCEGEYLKKRIVKHMKARAYADMQIYDFPLCVTSFCETDEYPLSIANVKIDGIKIDISESIKTVSLEAKGALDAKSGYLKTVKHLLKEPIFLSSTAQKAIEIEYISTVHKNDKVYVCRVPVPCNKFDFRFEMIGDGSCNYNINLNAFGFFDDGAKTPNHTDDSPDVSVTIEDWMFPRDGVSVTITEKIPVPNLQEPEFCEEALANLQLLGNEPASVSK